MQISKCLVPKAKQRMEIEGFIYFVQKYKSHAAHVVLCISSNFIGFNLKKEIRHQRFVGFNYEKIRAAITLITSFISRILDQLPLLTKKMFISFRESK
jgi:hypothetical protein